MKKLLLVVFSADLGSISLENCLIDLFRSRVDLRVHHFTGLQRKSVAAGKINKKLNFFLRLFSWPAMWLAILRARIEKRQILFQYISPALFSYPLLRQTDCFMATDWTRKLHASETEKLFSSKIAIILHRRMLKRLGGVLGMSQAVRETFLKDYHVPPGKVFPIKMPFKVPELNVSTDYYNVSDTVRFLFVGGDWERKGGDLLLAWARNRLPKNATLTLVTNTSLPELSPRVIQFKNVKSGDETHRKIFSSHDVLVLPTKREGLPLVLGEAASYGLAIITTKMAYGAPEIVKNNVNGFICESQEEVMLKMEELCTNSQSISAMRRASRRIIEEDFNEEKVFAEYSRIIFGNSDISGHSRQSNNATPAGKN